MRSANNSPRAFRDSRVYLNGTLKSTPVLIGSKVLIVEHPKQRMDQYPGTRPRSRAFS
jgi:hypothetical protein